MKLKEFVILANHEDRSGHHKEADKLDELILKMAQLAHLSSGGYERAQPGYWPIVNYFGAPQRWDDPSIDRSAKDDKKKLASGLKEDGVIGYHEVRKALDTMTSIWRMDGGSSMGKNFHYMTLAGEIATLQTVEE